jgi:hypothetical protein
MESHMNRGIWIIGLAAFPLGALAQDGFDYTYVEGAYLSSDVDAGPFSADGDGLGVRGSIALGGKLHLFGEYATQDHDFDVDTSSWSVGVGLHHPIQSNLDFVAELGWVKIEVDTPFGSADDDGLGLSGGVRYRAGQKVELEGMLHYVDMDGSDTSLGLGGRYYFTPSFALTSGLLFDDNDTGWSIGVRASFGR